MLLPKTPPTRWVAAFSLTGALALGGLGCGASNRGTPVADVNVSQDTTLGAGDVFDVRVYGETALSGTYRVGPDGTIDFPFIGRVDVEGLEPMSVADLIATRLREGEYLREPQVSIFVKEYNSKRISVMGAVSHAGNFPMVTGLTVVQAIGLAGGFSALANRNETVVSRPGPEGIQRYRVPVDDVTRGRAQDFPLRAGDIVYVPERLF
jgi:polysaccharide export outer membrane protein